jgi:Peptidase inhibitor family I36
MAMDEITWNGYSPFRISQDSYPRQRKHYHMQTRKRLAGAVTAVAFGLVAALAIPGSASAATRNISQFPVFPACSDSPYLLCLFYGSNGTGAMWGSTTGAGPMPGDRFPPPGAGAGQLVQGNVASASCDTSTLNCYFYSAPNYAGNVDYLLPQRSGNLFYTWNDLGSVRVA